YDGARLRPWQWRVGLFLYDLLAGRDNIRRSRALPFPAVRREFPDLGAAGLRGAAEVFDAQMGDARLCLDVVRSACERGLEAANHLEATAFERAGGRLIGVRAVDRLNGREIPIRARVILNTAGPWADAVRRLAGEDGQALL